MTKEIKKDRSVFDLSDGFGTEDVKAILGGIWRFIVGILKIIFWPYVWIYRICGRSIRFIRVKATENPLSEDERKFIESIPGFFIITGIFSGIFLVALGWFIDQNLWKLGDFFENIDFGVFVEGIYLFFFASHPDWSVSEIILTILGVDDRSVDPVYDRFGILDIIGFLFDIIGDIIEDPLLLFIGIVAVLFVVVIIFIVISETGIVKTIVSVVSRVLGIVATTPKKGFNKVNAVYLRFNSIISNAIIGENRLATYTVSYHKKLLLYIYLLGILTFLSGLIVIMSGRIDDDYLYQFILIILFTVGFGVGVIEMAIIVRFMDMISRQKYSTEKA